MSATLRRNQHSTSHSPWAHVAQAAAALAAGMGVGRFVYTPILPLMHAQAGLSAGANLATANFAGYLIGALAGTFASGLIRSPAVLRGSLLVLTATLATMPFTLSTTVWITLRLLAGFTSALIFVIAASSLLSHLREHPGHLPGWAFGGVGAGIALSGVLVLVLRSVADWQAADRRILRRPASRPPGRVTPLLHQGYHQALMLASATVLAAALAAAVFRIRFPHHLPTQARYAPTPRERRATGERIHRSMTSIGYLSVFEPEQLNPPYSALSLNPSRDCSQTC
jgi:MFS family permease